MKTEAVVREKTASSTSQEYIEILGDTVVPSRLLLSVIISIVASLGCYFLGKAIFPAIASEKMVPSYSLLLGIGGSLVALVINARFFTPSRVLTEAETSSEGFEEILLDLQADPKEEYDLIKNDPVTRKEVEELGILETIKRSGGK
ncbi:hypothetical protein NDK47_04800 [Brevibacillus ruminantium]|uniref:Uncharacterized protein n=1 Tax=Brevibacillus ruminantium TaxID=2950604 RepID=A0ABY4WKF2_9BACL|nr:hypothetical protein [Brevibacillus ruminantium]USG66623.1 hypothetical protein NDK47_04800 [Brevibacillus ruminantium]